MKRSTTGCVYCDRGEPKQSEDGVWYHWEMRAVCRKPDNWRRYMVRAGKDMTKLRPRLRRGPVEVRYNDDGTVDEIVGKRCRVHVEQMDTGLWFVEVGTRKHGYFACYMSKQGKVFEERD